MNLHKILVVRNDKLGDFMLTLPTFAQLKSALPDTQLHALISGYTRAAAELCPDIDGIVIDPGPNANLQQRRELFKLIKSQNYDAVITLISTTEIGALLFLARIPYRLAPASKLAQIFYNRRLTQRRSRSEKPEHLYNRELALQLLKDAGIKTATTPTPASLSFPAATTARIREEFCTKNRIDPQSRLIFIHPGSGGSANNLSLQQYAELARQLHPDLPHRLIISAGPGEIDYATQLSQLIADHAPVLYHSQAGLQLFCHHIAFADLFISGSTGPLHIAGALDRPTAAFYTRRRSATSLRWQTLNSAERRLAFSPPDGAEPEDMSTIDIGRVAATINGHYFNQKAVVTADVPRDPHTSQT